MIVLMFIRQWKMSEYLSFGTTWVVYVTNSSPIDSTNPFSSSSHLPEGRRSLKEAYVPTAPEIPQGFRRLRYATLSASLRAKFASSFPKVVGIAGLPWVLASITVFASLRAIAERPTASFSYAGIITDFRALRRSLA